MTSRPAGLSGDILTGPDRVRLATAVMDGFAERTGLSSTRRPVRYLWTDAFAVCNYVALHDATGDARFLERARALVDQVHLVLGRHRDDDPRVGWISGMPDQEGGRHPTAGGLRIGKSQRERNETEPYRADAEWDRDGQYYHYLTKWMFALLQMARATGDATYHRWGVELAEAAHASFVTRSHGRLSMRWKMSIDLSRPLVPSEGHHDPLDGLVTLSCLEATSSPTAPAGLASEIEELAAMCAGRSWTTSDALGIGGLLTDALRCRQLDERGHPTGAALFGVLVRDSATSLGSLFDLGFQRLPAGRRLAFRELGLVLGLEAVERLGGASRLPVPDDEAERYRSLLDGVSRYVPLGRSVLDFWGDDRHRAVSTWIEHRDISDVMWVTCLLPEGFLVW